MFSNCEILGQNYFHKYCAGAAVLLNLSASCEYLLISKIIKSVCSSTSHKKLRLSGFSLSFSYDHL